MEKGFIYRRGNSASVLPILTKEKFELSQALAEPNHINWGQN